MSNLKTIEQKAEVGVIVARFQSPYLHDGHVEILNTVIANHPRVIVFLGLSPCKCTKNNPLDFAARKAMIEEKYPNVEVYYIEDIGNSEVWSKNLDRMIAKCIGPNLKVLLYGSRDSFINSYMGRYPTIELIPSKYISARDIRKDVGVKSKNTLAFREGVVWAVENQYASGKPCVDMAVVNFEKKELLLGQKPNETLLRFSGGHFDVFKDKSYEDTAIREVQEETGVVAEVVNYIGSIISGDWRYQAEQDKIVTALFAMKYIGGTPVANDDLSFVCWKSFMKNGKVAELDETIFVPTHRPLARMFNKWAERNI